MSRFGLYFHTLRYLRPTQVTARIWLRLHRPAVDLNPAPTPRRVVARFQTPIPAEPSLLGPTTIRLLNVQRDCVEAVDWDPPEADKLWIYNLHYFDDLNAQQADARTGWHVGWLDRWVQQVAPGRGNAWEPYPTSRRIVNWVKWSLRGNQPSRPVLDSLAAQTRWLVHRLEYHLLGNHLFANAKALLFAGLYCSGAEAESWRARGLAILNSELTEQVLDDGGHFELSPMYHASMLEDLLDLINLQQAYAVPVPPAWQDAAVRMLRWLQVVSHPDGQIAFFNDCAFDIAPTPAVLEDYAARLGLPIPDREVKPLHWLRDSGYVRVCAGPAYLICDCGAVGPDYLPGHAHADSLSFELSLRGQRIFVNSGTSQYGIGAERQRQRGTAAHNTVVVDGQDSSEVWAGFRVARRARAVVKEVAGGDVLSVVASHDGYRRLPGRNEHRRRWSVQPDGMRIDDHISGAFTRAEAYFHLHPDLTATRADANTILLRRSGEAVATVRYASADAIDILAGTWHPGFGRAIANQCLRVRLAGSDLTSHISWAATA